MNAEKMNVEVAKTPTSNRLNIEHRTSNIEHRTSNAQHRMKNKIPNTEHSTSPRCGFFIPLTPLRAVGLSNGSSNTRNEKLNPFFCFCKISFGSSWRFLPLLLPFIQDSMSESSLPGRWTLDVGVFATSMFISSAPSFIQT